MVELVFFDQDARCPECYCPLVLVGPVQVCPDCDAVHLWPAREWEVLDD